MQRRQLHLTLTVLFAATTHGACSTKVDAIDDKEQCEDGALQEDGSPILLGEPCYDDWAQHVAELHAIVVAAVEPLTGPCITLATALGKPDTWSAIEDPVMRARAACSAAASFAIPDTFSCTATVDVGSCAIAELTCTPATAGEMPPPWLDELAETLPHFSAFCCDAPDAAAELLVDSPNCSSDAPGVEACASKLAETSGVPAYADLAQVVCGAVASSF